MKNPVPIKKILTVYRYNVCISGLQLLKLAEAKVTWLPVPVTSPHGNFATVTSPQKLRHMVTSPHFEKVKGDVGIVGKCVGVWGEEGGMWEKV